MWISKRKWKEVNVRIKKYEAHVCQCEEKIDTLIELTEKILLEQSPESLEEMRDIEKIDEFVNDFIRSP
mgnify:CR=1 FL=1